MSNIAIVGGGISGLSVGYFLQKQDINHNIKIFELDSFGGQIQSEKKEDILFEKGPDFFYSDGLFINHIIDELNLKDELLKATKSENQKYIFKEKQLLKFPNEVKQFSKSSLIFLGRRLKIKSFLKKKLSYWEKMSLFDVFKTIFGEQGAEYLGSGLSRGIFGSEAEDIEFSSAFPNLYKNLLSQDSVNKAHEKTINDKDIFYREKLNIKEVNEKEKGLYSFRNGMKTLSDAFYQHLKNNKVKFEKIKITKILKIKSDYFLYAKGKKYGPFDKIYFTIAPSELSKIFKEMNKNLSRLLSNIPISDLTTVTTVWNKKDFSSSGFGFITPRKEKINILGSIYLSNLFPEKYNKKQFIMKSYFSADTDLFSDQEIEAMILEAFQRLFKIKRKPIASSINRVKPGLPKYYIGYSENNKNIMHEIEKHKDIFLLGWHFSGMSINSNIEKSFNLINNH